MIVRKRMIVRTKRIMTRMIDIRVLVTFLYFLKYRCKQKIQRAPFTPPRWVGTGSQASCQLLLLLLLSL